MLTVNLRKFHYSGYPATVVYKNVLRVEPKHGFLCVVFADGSVTYIPAHVVLSCTVYKEAV